MKEKLNSKNLEIEYRKLNKLDWEFVSEIYCQGIETENATFELESPSWDEWDNSHLQFGRIVAQTNNKVIAWSALSAVSSRCVYEGVAEVSVYVHKDYIKKNIGTRLLKKLIQASEENGIWTLQSGIFPENIGSIIIHKNNGFRKVGYREKVGKLKGIWRDTILMERRSSIVGIS